MAMPAVGRTVCHPQEEASPSIPDRLFKIVLVGNSAVGKTSFLRRFCEDRFAPGLAATVGEFSRHSGKGKEKRAQEGTGGPVGVAMGPCWYRALTRLIPQRGRKGKVKSSSCTVPAAKLIPHGVEPLNTSFVQPEGNCSQQRWILGPRSPLSSSLF